MDLKTIDPLNLDQEEDFHRPNESKEQVSRAKFYNGRAQYGYSRVCTI